MLKRLFLSISCMFLLSLSVQAVENIVNSNLNSFFTQTDTRNANAICFMYPPKDFKCACRFSDNSVVWSSKEITKITGLSDGSPKYGKIKECEGRAFINSGSKK